MRSLRARLIVGLLALAAVGLLLLAGITYAEQRSFLLDRVDQQLRAAPVAVATELADRGVGFHPGPAHAPGRAPRPAGGDGGEGAGQPRFGLPPGTYGERRAADGSVLGAASVGFAGDSTSRPRLPRSLPIGRPVDVSGSGGSGYRALAVRDLDGSGTLVVAIPLSETNTTLDRLLLVEGLVIAGVLIGLGVLAWILVRVGLLPLDRIEVTAGRIAGGDLAQRVETTDPRTEVGRLGIALNAMLDRLERAFAERQASEERLRQFLADASHELRTPLSSIRGYAELFRIGPAREPAETERAMRRIEEEAKRMGVLVEDLLALARLDEIQDAEHEHVDLAALAGDAVDDARAAAPDRAIELRAVPGTTVVGNEHALRQVLGNLLRNALVHTPPGTPVEVTVEPTPGAPPRARIEVRDHGPGLPTDDPDALFERFWRAEGGRERGRGGAGLGLAIVAGIVDAHGGRVHADAAPGGGAAFVVELPALPALPAGDGG
jgi:two-component system OmpR family sensor kinase